MARVRTRQMLVLAPMNSVRPSAPPGFRSAGIRPPLPCSGGGAHAVALLGALTEAVPTEAVPPTAQLELEQG